MRGDVYMERNREQIVLQRITIVCKRQSETQKNRELRSEKIRKDKKQSPLHSKSTGDGRYLRKGEMMRPMVKWPCNFHFSTFDKCR